MSSPAAQFPEPAEQPLTWAEIAESQDGVVARRQALAHGLSKAAWDWRLSTGRWRLVLPGVAVLHSGTPTDSQRAWASVVHAGTGAALSGDAALLAHGITLSTPSAIDVAVPWPREARGHELLGGPALVCHSVRGLSA